MIKILISLLFIITTSVAASDETYIFEAKGEFAKELKSLVEKYSKEGKIDVKVYLKNTDDNSIINSIFGTNKLDLNGQKLYDKMCSSCHGAKGKKSPGYGARVLSSMTKDEIEEAIKNYDNDTKYGGSGKMLMQSVAISLRKVELNSIINYLKNTSPTQQNQNATQQKNEAPSSYLQ